MKLPFHQNHMKKTLIILIKSYETDFHWKESFIAHKTTFTIMSNHIVTVHVLLYFA